MSTKKSFKDTPKTFISITLSFILSILLVTVSVLFILQLTVLNEDFFRKEIDKSKYVNNIMSEIQKSFNSYGIVSGFNEEFFETTVSMDLVKADIFREVSRLYSDENKKIDAQGFQQHLYKSLVSDVEQRGIEIDQAVDDALVHLSIICTETYVNKVELPFINKIAFVLQKAQKINYMGMIVIIILTIICIAAIYYINSSRRKKTRYYMYAIGGAFFMILTPALITFFSDKVQNVAISSRALYSLITSYINDAIYITLYFGVGFAVAWLMFFFWRKKILYSGKTYVRRM